MPKFVFGLPGYKAGMVTVFNGPIAEAATIVGFDSCVVLDRKEVGDRDCLRIAANRARKLTKPLEGIYKKLDIEPRRTIRSFFVPVGYRSDFCSGFELGPNVFYVGQKVAVAGTTKGRGFSGVVKRHGFKDRGRSSISLAHRVHGSTGQRTSPGRVFPGKKMAGRYGHETCTISGLKVLEIDADTRFMIVKGAIPGATGSEVIVKMEIGS